MADIIPQNVDRLEMSVSLKAYFEAKFDALDKANSIAYTAMEKRLEGMNEFRDTLRDQASKFVTRSELEVIRERYDSDIRVLREYKSLLEGKASQQSVNVAMLISALSLLIGIISITLKLM